ncbi:hypothetical protein [Actinotalea subterranea]|uniref:hypothetical protein n=1 Tax=Actinotalea subterranea TaxID=2607497 RepID=UPI0011EFB3DD|nr:hypothetical protein [Actinotalea subterranea]
MILYTRLVSARRGAAQTLIFPAFGLLVLLATLSGVPWAIQHPDLARTYIDPRAKAVYLIIAAAAIVVTIVFVAVHIATGLGLLASLYGRRTARGTTVLASPWGVVGYPRQRITVHPGRITVRLVDEPPAFQFYAYGIQRLYLTQDDATLHILSYVKYDGASRRRLVDWLTSQGITPDFEGDDATLPIY